MTIEMINLATRSIAELKKSAPLGRVSSVAGCQVTVFGLGRRVSLGQTARFLHHPSLRAEIIRIESEQVVMLVEGPMDQVTVGDRVRVDAAKPFKPDWSWIGRVIDPDGAPLDGRPIFGGPVAMHLQSPPPRPNARMGFGDRMATGLAVFDTLLPIVEGQRIGLFAGSGVGKSTLLANLALNLSADIIVLGLVGERGREVREFVANVLGPEGLSRSVVVAATSDRAPQVRRRCAWAAMTVAEYFRDQGKSVVLLIDSVTRFAEAHRELSVAAGEPSTLRGFPASTAPAIASLCERAGPGEEGSGSITAVFSVLVAGSDMEEPVADMLRGVLDGHVVLDREIAERGRFPAVDLLRSVSRSLPDAATAEENVLIAATRSILGTYSRSAMMIEAGLYSTGSDARIDEAIEFEPGLDAFVGTMVPDGVSASFDLLRRALPQAVRTQAAAAKRAEAQRQGVE